MNSGRMGWNGGMHDQDKGAADDANGRDVADEIEIQPFIQRRVDGGGRIEPEKRIPIGRSMHDCVGGDIAGGTRPILDDQ
jgi:hypothetical protein